jgi:hypothetical protein
MTKKGAIGLNCNCKSDFHGYNILHIDFQLLRLFAAYNSGKVFFWNYGPQN